jgi:hypothetical protein
LEDALLFICTSKSERFPELLASSCDLAKKKKGACIRTAKPGLRELRRLTHTRDACSRSGEGGR